MKQVATQSIRNVGLVVGLPCLFIFQVTLFVCMSGYHVCISGYPVGLPCLYFRLTSLVYVGLPCVFFGQVNLTCLCVRLPCVCGQLPTPLITILTCKTPW